MGTAGGREGWLRTALTGIGVGRGVALLLDDRYRQGAYRRLCPEHWVIRRGNAEKDMRQFWLD